VKSKVVVTVVLLLAAMLSFGAAPAQETSSGREYHVSAGGNDANDGSPSAMLKTVSAAALLAQPGDVITVHEGVYRERVNPPRGGESQTKPIVYQAAPGEKVEIKGSEVVSGWEKVQNDTWKVVLPNTFFGGYNPYKDLIHGDWFSPKDREHHTGAVYLNGEWLIEAATLEEVMTPAGTVPAWLRQSGQECLLNVAWLRRGGAAEKTVQIPAASFAAKNGTQNAPCSEGGECVGYILNGHWVKYEGVDFGEKTDSLEIRAASASSGGIIEVRLDGPDGERLGACSVPNTGDWQSWSTFKAELKPVSGVKTVCLVFRSNTYQPAAENVQLWHARVDDTTTIIHAQFKGVNPNEQLVEVNVRRAVFYPEKPGMNYITVRGFALRQAATQWAPPTSEQVGLIGTHWSRGWVIENNIVSHSVCSGIALGKHGDEFDNTSADTAEGYVKTIERAIARGWSKENIGHHIVRNNTISHCEQTGIVGSLGAVFSTITGNTIHDIHVRELFTGAEMAGIKLHGAIDVEIRGNHIYRTCRGLWLDWMAQGARISGNLFHNNSYEDLFVEVDHGPFVVDNNVFLSPVSLLDVSRGGAYAHNLMAGAIRVNLYDARLTPFHKAHSTELAGMHDNPCGDDRFFNNLFVKRADLRVYDKARLPLFMEDNVYLDGARASKHEKNPMVEKRFDPALMVVEKADGVYLEGAFETAWADGRTRKVVGTERLGKALVPDLPYENRDGSPLIVDADYLGAKRNVANPFPGPFELSHGGKQTLKVWPVASVN
jgi:alpha-N-arabinofuranosidase